MAAPVKAVHVADSAPGDNERTGSHPGEAALAAVVEAVASSRAVATDSDHAARALQLRGCIRLLRPIRDRGVQLLANGLEAYFSQGGDLETHLGLRPASGRHTVATLGKVEERNARLRQMAESLSGTTSEKARSLRELLLRAGSAQDALSKRQLERILDGPG